MRRLFSALKKSLSSTNPVAAPERTASFENLEDRRLMSLTVGSLLADNRGQVFVNLTSTSGTINKSTINKTSVILYSAGADKIYGNTDDVRLAENVVFNTNVNRIIVTTKVAPSVAYRIRLVASRIQTQTGVKLDGEFHGTFPTGNGTEGGDFNALTKVDKSITPTIRMTTTLGSLAIKLRGDKAPNSTNYFMTKSNQGFFDNVMFNKSTTGTGAVLESGIIKVGSDNKFFVTPPVDRNPETTGLAGSTATIAFSREPVNPAVEGNGFVFNMANNTNANRVFGSVTSGFNVLQAINALTAIDLAPEHQFSLANTATVPVNNSSVDHSTYVPFTNSIFIKRTAVQMRIVPISSATKVG